MSANSEASPAERSRAGAFHSRDFTLSAGSESDGASPRPALFHGEKGRRFPLDPAKTLEITGIAGRGKFARKASADCVRVLLRQDRDDVKTARLQGGRRAPISPANAHPKTEILQ